MKVNVTVTQAIVVEGKRSTRVAAGEFTRTPDASPETPEFFRQVDRFTAILLGLDKPKVKAE